MLAEVIDDAVLGDPEQVLVQGVGPCRSCPMPRTAPRRHVLGDVLGGLVVRSRSGLHEEEDAPDRSRFLEVRAQVVFLHRFQALDVVLSDHGVGSGSAGDWDCDRAGGRPSRSSPGSIA